MLGFRQNPLAQEKVYGADLVRPPGALPERAFLQRCVQCGACMRACPTNALQPCALEAGVEGLWTPRIIAKVGYCEYNCNLCGQVCPTGAIQLLPIDAKKETKIGLAVFDKKPLPALRVRPRVPRLRGALPHTAEIHLLRRARGGTARRAETDRKTAPD